MGGKFIFLFLFICKIAQIKANCVLNMQHDLSNNHPLILSMHDPKWISLSDSTKGSININRDQSVRLACAFRDPAKPNSFSKIKGQNIVTAKCKSGPNFEVDKRTYSFDDLQCDFPVEASDVKTGQECLGKDTELVKIGFKVGNEFVEEYVVCFDKTRKLTLFTEVTVPGAIDKSLTATRENTWLSSNEGFYSGIDMHSIYTCETQKDTFKKILNKDFFGNNRCCLQKGKLVTENDLVFAPEQASTNHYLNTVPQWSTCNRVNWLEVEKRVKNLATSLNRPLTVWSGTYRPMTLAAKWGFSYKDMYLHYKSDSNRGVAVPLYIWKVVFDQQSQKGLAIIEINNPHLALTDIESLLLCEDMCKNVNWMNFVERKTIRDGYVFCCEIHNFEHGFHFKTSPFPRATGGVIREENSRMG